MLGQVINTGITYTLDLRFYIPGYHTGYQVKALARLTLYIGFNLGSYIAVFHVYDTNKY